MVNPKKISKFMKLFFGAFHYKSISKKFSSGKYLVDKPLKSAIIDITYDCNLRCKMCWRYNKTSPQEFFNYKELDLEGHKKVIDILYDLGVRSVVIAGGEPFIKEWIVDYLEYIKSKGMSGTVITNGTLLNKKIIEKLIEIGWDNIMFSIDGYDAETYEFVRGKGMFKLVTKNIKMLSEIKRKKGAKKPKIMSNTILMDHNCKRIYKIFYLARDLGIESVGFARLTNWSVNYNTLRIKPKNNQSCIEALKRSIELSKKFNINTNARKFIYDIPAPKFCYFIFSSTYIDPAGNALVCCKIPKKIGNILEEDFRKFYFGDYMTKLRTDILEGKFPTICKWCYVDNIITNNLLYYIMTFNFSNLFSYLKRYYL